MDKVLSFRAKKEIQQVLFFLFKNVCLSLSSYYNRTNFSMETVLLLRLSRSHVLGKSSVFFVRWFWRPFFEQVVFALGVFVIPSVRDVSPVVKRHFGLFD